MVMAERIPASPFAQNFERLVASGYHVLPIAPDSKAPSEYRNGKWRPMREWQKFRDVPANAFMLRMWASWPDANIGVLTGTRATATHIVACADLDTNDHDTLSDLERALPYSPVLKRGRRGYSIFYLAPNGTKGFRTPVAELLTDTRQTVIPPSVHPDTGRAYQWTGTETLLTMRASELPVLTSDDIERFRDTVEAITKKPIAEPQEKTIIPFPDDDATVWRRLNNAAYADLDRWVPELGLPKLRKTAIGYQGVAHWRPSNRGRPINERSPNLSIMTGRGARDFGTGESMTALDLVQAALAIDLDHAFEWLGSRFGLADSPVTIDPPVIAPAPIRHDPATGEIAELEPAAPETEFTPDDELEELPEALTHVPGLLGQIIDWVCASNRKPNRTLALGTALSVIGTLVGGGLCGPSGRNGTHLYIACIAPSGAGKEYPKAACGLLLDACNSGSLNGPSDFKSHSAVVSELKANPVMLCAIDELGIMLGRILASNAKPHDGDISAILRELWGKNFTPYRTPAWAAARSEPIHNPGLTIYGSSTLEELFAAMTGKDVLNGFLNRWLFLPTKKRIMASEPQLESGDVPKHLALELARLRQWAHRLTEEMQAAPIGEPLGPKRKLRWGARADDVSKAMDAHMFRICEDPGKQIFFARTHEMAIRLATIRAAGNMSDVVQAVDMEWGRDVAFWAAQFTMRLARNNIAENDYHRNYNRVRNVIADAGTISMRDLRRKIKSLREFEWKDILSAMHEAGEVRSKKTIPPNGGTPSIIYEYSGD